VDFSAYQGFESTPQNVESRLLLVNNRYLPNSALLVSRMLGLKNVDDFTRLTGAPDNRPWVAAEYRDKSGASWKHLDLRKLVENPEFLQVGI
jgi:twitching motility protein PilI